MLVMIMAKLLQTTNEKVVYIYDENKDCKVIRRFKYEDFKCRLS